jgi:hypothetical protein
MKQYHSPTVDMIGSAARCIQGGASSGSDPGGIPQTFGFTDVPSNLEEN